MQFIDIHNHCAWDVDDGMKTIDETYNSLKNAQKDGIQAIVSTPHVVPGTITSEQLQAIQRRQNQLKQLAKKCNIEIYTGCEIMLNRYYKEVFDQHLFQTINNTQYVLVEFKGNKDISYSDKIETRLYDILNKGYTPIIAHVERYFQDEVDVERVFNWIDQGCIIQVNRTSLLGLSGKTRQKIATQLVENSCVHIIASDAHQAKGKRIGILSDIYKKIAKTYGQEIANTLLIDNPKHILQGELCELVSVEKQPLLKRLFRYKW